MEFFTETDDLPSSSIHHDLHAIPWLDLGVLVEAVEDAEALGGAVDASHTVGEGFHGIAGLRGDDLDTQGTCGLNFFQRQAAERVDGLARIALALGVALLGGEDEAVDVAAVAQRKDLELPLIAVRGGRSHRETVD